MAIIFAFGFSTAAAAIEFARISVQVERPVDHRSLEVDFPFKNAGASQRRIVSILPSCDCLTPRLEKSVFLPGESGHLKVEITLGQETSTAFRQVTVVTDDPTLPKTTLDLTITSTPTVDFDSRTLRWKLGEAPSEKQIMVKVADPKSTRLIGVTTSDPSFRAVLAKSPEPNSTQIIVCPSDTNRLVQVPIRLNTVVAGQQRVFVLLAAVR